MSMKRTKIIATLGPASDSSEVLSAMIEAGVDLVRLNFSHGTAAEHQKRAETVRSCAAQLNRTIGILADLQGPKIRIARFKSGSIQLKRGAEFTLDAALDEDHGDEHAVGIAYKSLPNDVKPSDTLLLDDGRIQMTVISIEDTRIRCRVQVGGILSNHKGINRKGGGLSADALTEKDKADIKSAAALNIDYLAISFPRSAQDIEQARALLNAEGSNAGVIAKIERAEAVNHIDEIIAASDGVMVARGDLAVEIGDAEVPAVQKRIIDRARALNCPVITATQMMESMITSTIPTRAEVSDVANAVLDLTDAVMLSAETATGAHPALVIETVARVCMAAEQERSTQASGHRMECAFHRADEAIAMAAVYTANHLDISAIIALTESGRTPLWMSRLRTGIPIFGLSRHAHTRGRMTLYRDVYPIEFDVTNRALDAINKDAIDTIKARNLVQPNQCVILTKGDQMGIHGGTNAMKILKVPE